MTTPALSRLRHHIVAPAFAHAAVLTALLAGAAQAQPMADPGDKATARKLEWRETEGEPGRWARIDTRVPAEGRRFFVTGLDVLAPLSVQVAAEDTGRPLSVSLHRHAWSQVAASGDTGTAGIYRLDGRVHGTLGVKLVPTDGRTARATLLVWQGEPIRRDFSSVLVPPEGSDGSDGSDTHGPAGGTTGTWTTHAILGVLVVIAGLLGALVFRRRGAATNLLAFAGLGLAVAAGPWSTPAFAADPDKDKPPVAPLDKDKDKPPVAPPDKDKDKPPVAPPDKDKDKPPVAPPDKDKDGPLPEESGPAPEGDFASRIASLEQHARDLHARSQADRREIERLRLLVEEDREHEPDPDRLPPMALSCRPPLDGTSDTYERARREQWEAFEACQSCYAGPLDDLERQLELYERLRILYGSARTDLAKMVAAGDMAPKPHYMVDSAWQAQKQKINLAFQQTQKAYDDTHLEFRDKLTGIVDAIGACEARHNNNPLWRETTGRLFLESISASYRRND